ncbi:MAG: hypothetical protein JST12_14905 [Armatimonadetes bacterium]|nr:hypothetical protein [Armatimonadota bacterium]
MVTTLVLAIAANSLSGGFMGHTPPQISMDDMFGSMRKPHVVVKVVEDRKRTKALYARIQKEKTRNSQLEATIKSLQEQLLVAKNQSNQATGPTTAQTKPTQPTIQTVVRETMVATISFVTPDGKPIDDLPVRVVVADPKDTVVPQPDSDKGTVLKTGTAGPGAIKLDVKQFPATLSYVIANKDWEIRDTPTCMLTLIGQEGVVASAVPFGDDSQGVYSSDEYRPYQQIGLPHLLTDFLVTGTTQKGSQKKKKPTKPAPKKAPPKQQPPKQVTPKIVYKDVVRKYNPPPITVVRRSADVEFHGAPKTEVRAGSTLIATLDEQGTASVNIDEQTMAPGEFSLDRQEGALHYTANLPHEEINPYAKNTIDLPQPKLTSIDDVAVSAIDCSKVGWMTADELRNKLGKPAKTINPAKDAVNPLTEVDYPKDGMKFFLRNITLGRKPTQVVDSAVLTSEGAGTVAGVKVGDSEEKLVAQLGNFEAFRKEGAAFVRTYLNEGLAFEVVDGRIQAIHIQRSTSALVSGVEFEQPRFRLSVFLDLGNPSGGATADQSGLFKDSFASMKGLLLANNPESSDFILKTRLVNFVKSTDKVIGTMPYRVQSTVEVGYDLIDSTTMKSVTGEANSLPISGTMRATSTADYGADVAQGAAMLIVAELAAGQIKGDTARLAAQLAIGAVAGVSVERMNDVMARAIKRTDQICLENAAESISEKIQSAWLTPAMVLSADRKEGNLVLNVGTDQGVQTDSEFTILNGPTVLGNEERNGLVADYVVAKVTDVGKDQCTCKLLHMTRSISKKAEEDTKSEPAINEMKLLLSPETAIVRARLRLGRS